MTGYPNSVAARRRAPLAARVGLDEEQDAARRRARANADRAAGVVDRRRGDDRADSEAGEFASGCRFRIDLANRVAAELGLATCTGHVLGPLLLNQPGEFRGDRGHSARKPATSSAFALVLATSERNSPPVRQVALELARPARNRQLSADGVGCRAPEDGLVLRVLMSPRVREL